MTFCKRSALVCRSVTPLPQGNVKLDVHTCVCTFQVIKAVYNMQMNEGYTCDSSLYLYNSFCLWGSPLHF